MPESVLTRPEVFQRATIPILSADQLTSAAARALEEARQRLMGIEAMALESVTAAGVLDAWDETSIALEDAFGPISLLNSVHPEKEVREVADRALIDESIFITELFQNEALYQRVLRVDPQTPAQKQLRKDLLEAFEDSAVSLPPESPPPSTTTSHPLTNPAPHFPSTIRK